MKTARTVLGLFLLLCGSPGGQAIAQDNPRHTRAPIAMAGPIAVADSEAIVGSWSDGKNSIEFSARGDYVFKRQIPSAAGVPPVIQESGQYMLRGTRIYLNPPTGSDRVLEFTFQGQDTLVLTEGNETYTLSRR